MRGAPSSATHDVPFRRRAAPPEKGSSDRDCRSCACSDLAAARARRGQRTNQGPLRLTSPRLSLPHDPQRQRGTERETTPNSQPPNGKNGDPTTASRVESVLASPVALLTVPDRIRLLSSVSKAVIFVEGKRLDSSGPQSSQSMSKFASPLFSSVFQAAR